ncbi:MAG: phospholipase D-like domain-containing protein [Ignavibacteriota bacterium]
MKLLIQPGDGVLPLIKGIAAAKRSVQIAIFRFDQREIERALANAVSRGVVVTALIAHTNRAGEDSLRKLELRLLAAGVTVARTADDLIRYHGKWMIVDGKDLYVLAFNFTHPDIEHSRSFGVITQNREALREASKLFECDVARQPYESAGAGGIVVSPLTARPALARFIEAARKELVVYDPKVSDRAMLRLLTERAKAGVRVRIIGRVAGKRPDIESRKLATQRLHTRTMVRDNAWVFVGSQSLREMELDERREVGLIFRDSQIARRIGDTFEADWKASEKAPAQAAEPVTDMPTELIAKRVAKAVSKELPQVAPLVDGVMQELAGELGNVDLLPDDVQDTVKGAVKDAVKEVMKDVLEDAMVKARGLDEVA